MAFARARAAQGLRNGLRSSARVPVANKTFGRAHLEAKRYASSGHGHKSSSDIPWLVSALAITPPSCYYLWPTAGDSHHDDGHDDKMQFEHKGEAGFQQEHAEAYDKANEENEEMTVKAGEEGDEDKGDDDAEADGGDDEKDSKSSDDGQNGGDQQSKGGDSSVEGVNFKGKLKPDSDGAKHDVKSEPDAKGANKKRLDSGLQKNLGPPPTSEGEDNNSTAAKQKGLANTQTRHSEQIDESNEKSKKSDGTPETSKAVGTVDPGKK